MAGPFPGNLSISAVAANVRDANSIRENIVSQETAKVDKDLELETKKASEGMVALRSHRSASGVQTSADSTVQSATLKANHSFGERLKNFFAHFVERLEGDHESHKYRG